MPTIKRLEAVIVCHNYSDFLAETLPRNLAHFDNVVVVTGHDDVETKELCDHLGVTCRPTDLHEYEARESDTLCDTLGVNAAHRPPIGRFSKSRAIDFGLAYLHGDDWVVHMDADIWLPPNARNWMNKSLPQKDTIYGIDRFNCPDEQTWDKFIKQTARNSGLAQHIRNCILCPPPFPMGARISIPEYGGYIPIGYFQMWHGSTKRRYPLNHGSAERTDVLHAVQWPLNNRRLMPEMFCVHLDTNKQGRMGANWNGRKTPQFGGWDPYARRDPGRLRSVAQTAGLLSKKHHPTPAPQQPINVIVNPTPVTVNVPAPIVNVAAPNVTCYVCGCCDDECTCNGYCYRGPTC